MAATDLFAYRIRRWSALTWIVVICAAVFIAVRIAGAIMTDGAAARSLVDWLALPASLPSALHRPWTPLTYMFTHYDVFHLLFNMLWLYWFGIIFLSFSSSRRLIETYLAGGIAGAAVYLLFNLAASSASGHSMIGASGAVLAVVAATAVMTPRLKLNLMLIGPVEIRWIAVAVVALDVISLGNGNPGAHLAHLAGAGAGAAFVMARRRISLHGNKRNRTTVKSPADVSDDKAELDRLLDKIRISGYSSLTAEERRILFDISRK